MLVITLTHIMLNLINRLLKKYDTAHKELPIDHFGFMRLDERQISTVKPNFTTVLPPSSTVYKKQTKKYQSEMPSK